MVAIVIRHANDKEFDPVHRDDKQITRRGKREAARLGRKLIDKYGPPDIIYCSPMMRTKQTSEAMFKYVDEDPKIIIDRRLSRYFDRWERDHPSIFRETRKEDIPIRESRYMFKRRCDSFLRDVMSDSSGRIVWVITHALVFKRIFRKLGKRTPRYIEFLDYRRI